MKIRTYLTGLFFVSCVVVEAFAFAGKACQVPDNWSLLETSQKESAAAIVDLQTDKISLGQPFSFKFALCDKAHSIPDRVTADAIMPAHQHGMNYTPTVAFDEASKSFEVEDFLFHMPGEWEITISSYHGETATHYTKTVTIN